MPYTPYKTYCLLFLGALLVIPDTGVTKAHAADNGQNNAEDVLHSVKEASAHRLSGYAETGYEKLVSAPAGASGEEWNLRGSINYDTGRTVNLQADVRYAHTTVNAAKGNQLDGTLHAYYRDTGRLTGGVFVAANKTDAAISMLSIAGDDAKNYWGGVETAYLGDRFTLYSKAGYGVVKSSIIDIDQITGIVGARFYLTDNIRLEAEGSVKRYSFGSVDVNAWSGRVAALYRLQRVPVTLMAGYESQGARMNGVGGQDGTIGTVFAGLRVSLGSRSLKDEERSGVLWQ